MPLKNKFRYRSGKLRSQNVSKKKKTRVKKLEQLIRQTQLHWFQLHSLVMYGISFNTFETPFFKSLMTRVTAFSVVIVIKCKCKIYYKTNTTNI